MVTYYDHQWHFASGSSKWNTRIGSMECICCKKDINSAEEDWVSITKDTNSDWRYITWHRRCYPNQKGWEEIELNKVKFREEVEKLKLELSKYQDTEGNFTSEFYTALDELGIMLD